VTTCFLDSNRSYVIFINQKKFMGAREVFQSKHICCSRTHNPHGCSNMISSSDHSQLISRLHTKDGAYCEICVHNAEAIKGIKCNNESTCLLHIPTNAKVTFCIRERFNLIARLADLQLDIPCPGTQDFLQSKHTCRNKTNLMPMRRH